MKYQVHGEDSKPHQAQPNKVTSPIFPRDAILQLASCRICSGNAVAASRSTAVSPSFARSAKVRARSR